MCADVWQVYPPVCMLVSCVCTLPDCLCHTCSNCLPMPTHPCAHSQPLLPVVPSSSVCACPTYILMSAWSACACSVHLSMSYLCTHVCPVCPTCPICVPNMSYLCAHVCPVCPSVSYPCAMLRMPLNASPCLCADACSICMPMCMASRAYLPVTAPWSAWLSGCKALWVLGPT